MRHCALCCSDLRKSIENQGGYKRKHYETEDKDVDMEILITVMRIQMENPIQQVKIPLRLNGRVHQNSNYREKKSSTLATRAKLSS